MQDFRPFLLPADHLHSRWSAREVEGVWFEGHSQDGIASGPVWVPADASASRWAPTLKDGLQSFKGEDRDDAFEKFGLLSPVGT